MEDLKEQIARKLKQIEEMIGKEESKTKIESKRKELDQLLEKYLKEFDQ